MTAAPGPAAAQRAPALRLREAELLLEAPGRAGRWARAREASEGCSGRSALARGLWDKRDMSALGKSSPLPHRACSLTPWGPMMEISQSLKGRKKEGKKKREKEGKSGKVGGRKRNLKKEKKNLAIRK